MTPTTSLSYGREQLGGISGLHASEGGTRRGGSEPQESGSSTFAR